MWWLGDSARRIRYIQLMESVTILIPVYRGEATLRRLHHELSAAMPDMASEYEIIFVEDCGGDGSWRVISELAAADPHVRGIRMSRNYGQHNALLAGIRAARHEIILTMDDDLQHPVSEVGVMLEALTDDFDVIYGAPQEDRHGFLRDIASRLTKLALSEAMGASTARHVSAFRVFRTKLRQGFAEYRSPFVSIDVLLTWTTSRFGAINVRHLPRTIGTSGYTLRKLITHAVNLMTGFSTLPLQIASMTGFVLMLLGVLIFIGVLINYMIRGEEAPGFASLSCMIVIFSGAQLFSLGVIGEYLARMHFRSMDRPVYLVAETTGEERGTDGGPDG
jgi:undecaprenyl-phosphate 4-deoxy-4-formamido-L-arabinose transferase